MSEHTRHTRGRIVVGVDGSPHSRVALKWAAYLANVTNADIQAVYVWQTPESFGMGRTVPDTSYDPQVVAEKLLTSTVDAVFGTERPAGLVLQAEHGYPPKVLIRRSQTASMLVLGSRGRGGLAVMLLGSVSATCTEHAACPVLVVHDTEPPTDPQPAIR